MVAGVFGSDFWQLRMYALEPLIRHYLIYLEKYEKWLLRKWRRAVILSFCVFFLCPLGLSLARRYLSESVASWISWAIFVPTMLFYPFIWVAIKTIKKRFEELEEFRNRWK